MKNNINLIDIAKRNLTRKLFRSCSIVFSVAVVAASLFSITTVMWSVEGGLKKGAARLGADIMVVPGHAKSQAMNTLLAGEPSTFYMDRKLEAEIEKIRGVKKVATQVYLKTLRLGCCTVGDVLITAFDSEKDFTIIPWLEDELHKPLNNDEAVIGDELFALIIEARSHPNDKQPSIVRLFGMNFKIVSMLDDTGMKFIDNTVFITYDALDRIFSKGINIDNLKDKKNMISSILIQVEPGIDPDRIAALIEYYVPDAKAIVTKKVISSVRKQFFVLIRSIVTISIILWVMASLLIGIIFSMIVNERSREIGLLRAMGAKRNDIFRLVITEALALSIIGGVTGIICGGSLLFFFREYITSIVSVPYLWPTVREFGGLIIICLFLSLAAGTGSVLLPAVGAARMEPYNAIRKGE